LLLLVVTLIFELAKDKRSNVARRSRRRIATVFFEGAKQKQEEGKKGRNSWFSDLSV
jgi:hypothetical protein